MNAALVNLFKTYSDGVNWNILGGILLYGLAKNLKGRISLFILGSCLFGFLSYFIFTMFRIDSTWYLLVLIISFCSSILRLEYFLNALNVSLLIMFLFLSIFSKVSDYVLISCFVLSVIAAFGLMKFKHVTKISSIMLMVLSLFIYFEFGFLKYF